mmetsp:Transcript_22734/g.42691  ORF Transcript_22734/g.42691 Transcript_22734/m.42691 type:complete len:204 (-) Transcript_22734:283-894(-)
MISANPVPKASPPSESKDRGKGNSTKKIIFLDVDGVLATSRCALYDVTEEDAVFCNGDDHPLERRCIAELGRVVKATGAQIVVSSTWRVPSCQEMFAHLLDSLEKVGGMDTKTTVAGKTPELSLGRGFEIAKWISDAEKKGVRIRYVIFEDSPKHFKTIEAASLSEESLLKCVVDRKNHLVEGITKELADEAIRILNDDQAKY